MDEKHALEQSQPLLDQGSKHLDDLEALHTPEFPRPKPKRPWWKRAIRIALTIFVLHLVFKAVKRCRYTRHWFGGKEHHHEGKFELPPSEFDEKLFGFTPLSHHGKGAHGPGRIWEYNAAIQAMDADMVIDPNDTSALEPLHFSLSTKPDDLGLVSRGPIVGNVTFDSNAKGENIEVTVELFNHTHVGEHPFGKPGCKKHWKGPKHPGPPGRRPHGPPPVPTVKIVQVLSDEGLVEALAILAYVEHHHRGPPGPPPPDHPPPPPGHPHGPPPPPPPPHHGDDDGNRLPSFRKVPGSKGSCVKDPESRYRRWSLFGNSDDKPKRLPWGRRGHGPLVGAKIHVSFPKSADITSFKSELQHFKHSIGELKPSFGKFKVATAHGSINVAGLTAKSGLLASGSGGISGNFEVYDSLELKTTHAPIDVNVTLHNSPHDESKNVTVLSLSNVHGSTNATVSLVSDEESDLKSIFPPTYLVKSNTIANTTDIAFASQPVDSTLFFGADGVHANIIGAFAPAFDGKFRVKTVFSPSVELVVDETVEDPAGEGRKRVVTRNDKFAGTLGSVHWEDADEASVADEDEPKEYPSFIGVHGVKTKVTLKF